MSSAICRHTALLERRSPSCASCSGQPALRTHTLRWLPIDRVGRSGCCRHVAVRAEKLDAETDAEKITKKPDPKETTEKYGLEAGLWQVFTNKDPVTGKTKGQQAKDLLKRYGSAYLITSISFAIVSFAACYALVSAGVDVGALLAKVGLNVNATSEKVGTVAIAYAAHKALSPVRFPPTVALTPVVARMLGRDKEDASSSSNNGSGQ
ncbi:g9621 [Coccomyxa elongata]